MKAIVIIASLLIVLIALMAFIKMSNSKTENQPYEVLSNKDNIEFRYYPPVAMATVNMKANTYKELSSPGFRSLANYIFGGNEKEQKIAMTSPVHMNMNDSSSSMSFVMPAEYELNELPSPGDSNVKLSTSKEEYVAVIEFGGYANDEKIEEYKVKLNDALQNMGVQHLNNFRLLGYDPPYQVIGRKNEIIVGINKGDIPAKM